MEHIVEFERGYDCMKFECVHGSADCKPGGRGRHGRHGVNIRFVAKGGRGAVQFLLYTGWMPQHIPNSIVGRVVTDWGSPPMPADLGYHSKMPHYEGHEPMSEVCEYCDGQPCYYDGSTINANDAMYALVNGGDAALWVFLDGYYDSVFNGAAYPIPAEYAASLRSINQPRGATIK